jgi:aldehyde:ferredoxin oxidoreductase
VIKGYAGQILRVDLSNNEIKKQPLDETFAKKFLGGRGFGAKILFAEKLVDICHRSFHWHSVERV